MRIILLTVFFLFLNAEAKILEPYLPNPSRSRFLPSIENKGFIRTCLSCSRKFPPKLLKRLDFITLNDFRTLTRAQLVTALACFGIKRNTAPAVVVDDKTIYEKIYDCLINLGTEQGVSMKPIEPELLECKDNNKCGVYEDTLISYYQLCQSDIDECDDIGQIVTKCFDENPNFKQIFGTPQ